MKLILALFVAFAACSPPAEDAPPSPGDGVQRIVQKVIYDGHLTVKARLTYVNGTDNTITNGYWSANVSANGQSHGPFTHIPGIAGEGQLVCPNIWAYVCSDFDPNCATPFYSADPIGYVSRETQNGHLADPFDGHSPVETLACNYNIPNIPIVLGATGYKVYIGRSCTAAGGYTSGGATGIFTGHINTPHISGGNYTLDLGATSGPGGNRLAWTNIGNGCNNGPHIPNQNYSFSPITVCISILLPGPICVGWQNTFINW